MHAISGILRNNVTVFFFMYIRCICSTQDLFFSSMPKLKIYERKKKFQVIKLQLEIQFNFFVQKFPSLWEREKSSIFLSLTSLITTIRECTKICVPETLSFFWSDDSISVWNYATDGFQYRNVILWNIDSLNFYKQEAVSRSR